MSRQAENLNERLRSTSSLRRACRLWSIQTGYVNADGKWTDSSAETLKKLLSALCERSIETEADFQAAIEQRYQMRLECAIEAVGVGWEGEFNSLRLYLPETVKPSSVRAEVELESGGSRDCSSLRLTLERSKTHAGRRYHRYLLNLGEKLPTGYHRLILNWENEGSEVERRVFLMSAKKKVGGAAATKPPRAWGAFLPLYAIRSESDWGIGDLKDMERAQEFLREQGASFFGTLPMLAIPSQNDEIDPSPYSPVSRLFWNEIFLNLPELIEQAGSAELKNKLATDAAHLKTLREKKNVDYSGVYKLKREVLEKLATWFFETKKDEAEDYQVFLKRVPLAPEYARFRANNATNPTLSERYHLYVQFQLDRKLTELKARADRGEIAGLYLDFPVGVNGGGFDAARFSSQFLKNASAGAPPDLLFLGGQDWGFAPLHPVRIREEGYEYFIQCMRQHMRFASILRLDHIMAFHRIYAIPSGMKPKEGGYLRYQREEFFALLSIEAERAGVRVIGEDLGTVPEAVRQALDEHDCLGMWVLTFEVGNEPKKGIGRIKEKALACMNTHDMIPFAGHWAQRDVALFKELGILEPSVEKSWTKDRNKAVKAWKKDLGTDRMLPEVLRALAESGVEKLLVNIEDLWGETEPQNVPGTWKEFPNWQRKLRYSFEQWTKDPEVLEALKLINEGRERAVEPAKVTATGSDNRERTKRNPAEPRPI